MKVFLQILLPAIFIFLLWLSGRSAEAIGNGNMILGAVGLAALLLIWLLTVSFALLAGLSIYAPDKSSSANFSIWKYRAIWNPSKLTVICYVALSYATTVYFFAVVFRILDSVSAEAFHPGIKSIWTALYFSVVTIATVGYGDIIPVETAARFFVSAEILLGVAYSVLFLSVVAGFLREHD